MAIGRRSITFETPDGFLSFEIGGRGMRISIKEPRDQLDVDSDISPEDARDLADFIIENESRAIPRAFQPAEWGCQRCAFWSPDRDSLSGGARSFGRCFRRAPQPSETKEEPRGNYPRTRWAAWPLTEDVDWCGEWEWRPEAPAAQPEDGYGE